MVWEVRVDSQQKQMWVVGELTIFSVQDIRVRLLEALTTLDEIEIDLGDVTEVDTAGLQLMLLAKRKPGKTVKFCNHSDEVLRLINLADVGQVLGDPLLFKAH